MNQTRSRSSMTSNQAYNLIKTRPNHSVNLKSLDGFVFVENAHKVAEIFFKRIKEIPNPHESDEAKMLKDLLIKIANDKGIPLTNKRPR